jgi:hypothetical protein
MARTVQEAITRARKAIADPSGKRADDTTCCGYAVEAVNLIKGARPDLFIGVFAVSYDTLATTDPLPVPDQFFLTVATLIGTMIELQDEETSDHARGTLLSQIAMGALK